MTIQTFLSQATTRLLAAGIETARLDTLTLLEDELGSNRALLLAHIDQPLARPHLVNLNKKIAQRVSHLPLAYIRGKAYFYGHEFTINHHVLVPRPETETMLDILQTLPLPPKANIADIGTGSGAIAISAALILPDSRIDAFDINNNALAVARKNAREHGATITFYLSDLLYASNVSFYHAALANLPYIPEHYPINKAARHEPAQALFAGPDGLDVYRLLWSQLQQKPALHVLTEALPVQHAAMVALATASGYTLNHANGFIQYFVRSS